MMGICWGSWRSKAFHQLPSLPPLLPSVEASENLPIAEIH